MIIAGAWLLAVSMAMTTETPQAQAASAPTAESSLNEAPAGFIQLVPIHTPAPRYPPDALQDCVTGVLQVRFKVGRDGRVIEVIVLRGVSPSIDRAVEATIMAHWRFQPFPEDSAQPYQWVSTRIDFKMPECDEHEAAIPDPAPSVEPPERKPPDLNQGS